MYGRIRVQYYYYTFKAYKHTDNLVDALLNQIIINSEQIALRRLFEHRVMPYSWLLYGQAMKMLHTTNYNNY